MSRAAQPLVITIQGRHPWTRLLAAIACLWLVGLTIEKARAEPNSGDIEPVEFPRISVNGSPLALKFCYCRSPADGKPGAFYIAQTEITQQQFFAALKKTKEDQKAWVDAGGRQLEPVMPIYGLSVLEAAEFCKTLTANQADASGRLLVREFRLPTKAEWQYACRASQSSDWSKNMPKFNRWPDPEKLKMDPTYQTLHGKGKDLWQTLGLHEKRTFEGTQQDLYEMAEVAAQKDKGSMTPGVAGGTTTLEAEVLELLADFLAREEGVKLTLTRHKPVPLLPPTSTAHNAWNIHEMHGNVAEWVMEEPEDWGRLLANDRIKLSDRRFIQAGGHFGQALDRLKDIDAMTITGMVSEKFEDAARVGRAENLTGIRVVMVLGPNADYLVSLRRKHVGHMAPSEASAELQNLEKELPKLGLLAEGTAQEAKANVTRRMASLSYKADKIDDTISAAKRLPDDRYKRLLLDRLEREKESRE